MTELSPDDWVYHGMTTYVVTHHREESSEEVYFTDQNPTDLVRKLKEEDGKGIWICGGAEVVRRLVEEDLIDCYYLTAVSYTHLNKASAGNRGNLRHGRYDPDVDRQRLRLREKRNRILSHQTI